MSESPISSPLRLKSQGSILNLLDQEELKNLKRRKLTQPKVKFICKMASSNMDSDNLFEFAIEILKKRPDLRVPEEVLVIKSATENMSFFQKLNQKSLNVQMMLHEKICQRMNYEFFKRGHTVFNLGELPTKFYIVLKGAVNIFLPKDPSTLKKEIEDERLAYLQKGDTEGKPSLRIALSKLKRKSLAQKLRDNINDDQRIGKNANLFLSTVKDKIRASRRASQQVPNEIKEEENSEDSDAGECESPMMRRDLQNDDPFSKMMGGIHLEDLENREKFFEENVFKFTYISTIGPGGIFGELGLLRKKPRSATVVCKGHTEFAVLGAKDYKEVLETVERKKMENRINFFMNHVFRDVQRDCVVKFAYMFKKHKFLNGNFIYRQGEESKFVFLIKKGNVLIFKSVKEEEESGNKVMSLEDFLSDMKKSHEGRISNYKSWRFPLAQLGPGESFGEEDIYNGSNRTTNAVCNSQKATLYGIPRDHFTRIINEKKSISESFGNKIKVREEWYRKKVEKIQETRTPKIENKFLAKNSKNKDYLMRRDVEEIQVLTDILAFDQTPKKPEIMPSSSTLRQDESELGLSKLSNSAGNFYQRSPKQSFKTARATLIAASPLGDGYDSNSTGRILDKSKVTNLRSSIFTAKASVVGLGANGFVSQEALLQKNNKFAVNNEVSIQETDANASPLISKRTQSAAYIGSKKVIMEAQELGLVAHKSPPHANRRTITKKMDNVQKITSDNSDKRPHLINFHEIVSKQRRTLEDLLKSQNMTTEDLKQHDFLNTIALEIEKKNHVKQLIKLEKDISRRHFLMKNKMNNKNPEPPVVKREDTEQESIMKMKKKVEACIKQINMSYKLEVPGIFVVSPMYYQNEEIPRLLSSVSSISGPVGDQNYYSINHNGEKLQSLKSTSQSNRFATNKGSKIKKSKLNKTFGTLNVNAERKGSDSYPNLISPSTIILKGNLSERESFSRYRNYSLDKSIKQNFHVSGNAEALK